MSSAWMSTIVCLCLQKKSTIHQRSNVYSPPRAPRFMWRIDKDKCFVSSHKSFSYHERTTCTYVVLKINGLHIVLTRSNTRMFQASILFMSRLYLCFLQCIETFLGNQPLLSKQKIMTFCFYSQYLSGMITLLKFQFRCFGSNPTMQDIFFKISLQNPKI